MKKFLGFCLLWILAAPSGAQDGRYRSPHYVVFSPDQTTAYVVNQTANTVSVLDADSRVVEREIAVGHRPTHAVVAPDGRRLYVTSNSGSTVEVVDLEAGAVMESFATGGHEPYGVTLDSQGGRLFVVNALSGTLSALDAASGERLYQTETGRQPRFVTLTPGGQRLIVTNGLSRSLTIIGTASGRVLETRNLGRASLLRQVVCTPDGRWAFVAHVISHDELMTTQMERGLIHSNGISVVDLEKSGHYATVLLDRLLSGAANPWGLDLSADGRTLYVTLAGVHEIALVDVPALLKLVREEGPEKLALDVETASRRGVVRRVPSGGVGPRGVAFNKRTGELWVTHYFSEDVAILSGEGELVTTVPLGPSRAMTDWRRGEMLFNDARLCFQQWFSCASCHEEDAVMDGLNWDLANDGLGNPKSAKSLHDVHDTPPAMWRGVRRDMEAAVAAGQRFLGFIPKPENQRALLAFLSRPPRAPNPYRSEDPEALRRGAEVFRQAGCSECHTAPTYADRFSYDLGLTGKDDLASSFDTPSLRDCYRTAPYLHDGRAATLEAIFKEHNPDDLHGQTGDLSEGAFRDLMRYVRSL